MNRTSMNKLCRYTAVVALAATQFFCTIKVANADPVRVSEEDGRKAIISKVAPTVPPLARQAHLGGKVVVDMTVAEAGNVENVSVVSGNPILGGAVVSATKKWTFSPFKADGKPSKAIVRATFEFGS